MNIRSRSDGTKYPVHGRSLFSNPARNRTFQRDIHFGDESEARRSVTFADEYWESHPSHHDRSRLVLAMNEARNRARVGSKNERLSPEERERYREAEARLTSWIDAHKGQTERKQTAYSHPGAGRPERDPPNQKPVGEGYLWYADDATKGRSDSREEAEKSLARALHMKSLAGLATREGADGTYYYSTEEEADKDLDGAFAWSVTAAGDESED